mgnify:CR=1 FL=1
MPGEASVTVSSSPRPMENGVPKIIMFQENGCGGTSQIKTYQHFGTSLDVNISATEAAAMLKLAEKMR